MAQCHYYETPKREDRRPPQEGEKKQPIHERCLTNAAAEGTVHVGSPTTGKAFAFHFCATHLAEAHQAAENAKRKEVKHV